VISTFVISAIHEKFGLLLQEAKSAINATKATMADPPLEVLGKEGKAGLGRAALLLGRHGMALFCKSTHDIISFVDLDARPSAAAR
jgi:hypothetical protein